MKQGQTPAILCQPMMLPSDLADEALKNAVEQNPANAPSEAAIARLQAMLPSKLPRKDLLAVLTSKYFGPDGITLSVGFLETTSDELAERILSHMNAWSEFANVKFVRTSDSRNAQVRISRSGSGYWSYLGTDVLLIPRGQPTMNLQGFSMQTSESEYRRVVRHETGHTLGFPHEHLRADIIALLDRNKVIQWGQRVLGWNRQTVIEQILTPLSEDEILGTPGADQRSIMTYQLPGEVTRSGQPILGGLDLSPLDKEFVGKLYPKKDGPIDPPPDGAGLEVLATIAPGKYRLVKAGEVLDGDQADDQAAQFQQLKPEGMAQADWSEIIRKAIELILLWLKTKDAKEPDEETDVNQLDDDQLEEVNAGAMGMGKAARRSATAAPQKTNQPQQQAGCAPQGQQQAGCAGQLQQQRAFDGC